MKNYKTTIYISLIMILAGCAGTHQLNPNGEKLPIEKSQEFELGYKKAILDNAQRWEDRGMNKAKSALSNYANEIKASEAGRAARDKGYLTETRAMVIKNHDGSVTIKTVGGTLKNDLNANQIVDYYKDKKNLLPTYNTPISTSSNNIINNQQPLLLKESFKLHSEKYIDETKGKIEDNKALLKQRIVSLPKNELSEGIIDLYSLNCSSDKTTFNCSFKNQNVRNSFCKETGVCK